MIPPSRFWLWWIITLAWHWIEPNRQHWCVRCHQYCRVVLLFESETIKISLKISQGGIIPGFSNTPPLDDTITHWSTVASLRKIDFDVFLASFCHDNKYILMHSWLLYKTDEQFVFCSFENQIKQVLRINKGKANSVKTVIYNRLSTNSTTCLLKMSGRQSPNLVGTLLEKTNMAPSKPIHNHAW